MMMKELKGLVLVLTLMVMVDGLKHDDDSSSSSMQQQHQQLKTNNKRRETLLQQYNAELKLADNSSSNLPPKPQHGNATSHGILSSGIPSICVNFPSSLNVFDSNISKMKSSWGTIPNSAGSAHRCKSANGSEFCVVHASSKIFGICVPAECAKGNRTVLSKTFAYSFTVWWFATVDPKPWQATCGWHKNELSQEGAAFIGMLLSAMILGICGIITARCRCTRDYADAYVNYLRKQQERAHRLNTQDGESLKRKRSKPQFIWEAPPSPYSSVQSQKQAIASSPQTPGRPNSKESGDGDIPQMRRSFHGTDPIVPRESQINETDGLDNQRNVKVKHERRCCGCLKWHGTTTVSMQQSHEKGSFDTLFSNEESLLHQSSSINAHENVDLDPPKTPTKALLCCWQRASGSDASEEPAEGNFCYSFWRAVPYYVTAIFESEDAEKTVPRLIPHLDGLRVLAFFHVVLGSAAYYMRTLGIESEASIVPPDGVLASTNFQFVLASDFSNDTLLLLGGFLAFHSLIRRVDQQLNFEGTQVSSTLDKLRESVKAISKGVVMKIVRVVPLYYTIVGFYALLGNSLGEGPFWDLIFSGTKACKNHWWTNLLFVNNVVPGPSQNEDNGSDTVWTSRCLPFTSYIAIDMQLFLVVTPILILLYVWKRLAAFILILILMAISIILSGLIVNKHSLSSLVQFDSDNYQAQSFNVWTEEYLWKFYLQPYTRALPWLLGMFMAMSFHLHAILKGIQLQTRRRPDRPHKIFSWDRTTTSWQALLRGGASQASNVRPVMSRLFGNTRKHRMEALDIWDALIVAVSGALLAAISFGSVNLYSNGSDDQIFWYTAFSRIAWSMGLGAMLAACIWENRGIVAKVLAHNVFRQISRRVYAALLVQQILFQILLYSRTSLFSYSNSELVIWWAGTSFLSLCVGEIMHRLLARPIWKGVHLMLDPKQRLIETTPQSGDHRDSHKGSASSSPVRRIKWEDSKAAGTEPEERPTLNSRPIDTDHGAIELSAEQPATQGTPSGDSKRNGVMNDNHSTANDECSEEEDDRFRFPAHRMPSTRRLPIREAYRSRKQKKFGGFSP